MKKQRPYRQVPILLHDEYECTGFEQDGEFYVPYRALEHIHKTHSYWDRINKRFKIYLNAESTKVQAITQYDFQGNYLRYDLVRVENWNVQFDRSGIPETIYNWGTAYNPCTIAQYGLQHYSLYRNNPSSTHKNKVIRVANWLLNHQDSTNGGWPYLFNHAFFYKRFPEIKAPWHSAIAIGQAMSLLTRAYHMTREPVYTRAALRGMELMKTPTAFGGVLAKFENKYWFYEECPTNPPSYILNGFMFALIGLYDLYSTTSSQEALELYKQGILTLKRMLPLYDLGYRTAYDLSHYTTDGGYPNPGKWGYHILHIHQLMTIQSIEPYPKFQEALDRWIGYLKGKTL